MIISTSSYNVQLTAEISHYVEATLRRELKQVAGHIVAVDVRLDCIEALYGRSETSAVVRLELNNDQTLVVEILDDNVYTAVRLGALESARKVRRQTPQSAQVRGQWLPDTSHAFSRYTAPNV